MKKQILGGIAIFFCSIAFAQKPPVKNLVFEGAGLRGIAYCGVVGELESKKIMESVEKVGGTSSGAIVALMISLGYSGKEMQEIIAHTSFKKFNDGNYFFAGGVNRLKKYFGWYRGARFEKWIGRIINNKTANTDITFAEMHQRGFKDIYITGTCLNKQELVIFSYETYPKMKVKDAIRISVSIPLYFEAVFIDTDGNIIKHPKQKEGLDIMVDGGITANFPITLFDSMSHPNFSTIGFRIDSDEQIKNDKEGRKLALFPIGNLNQYLGAFYNIVSENLNRQLLTKEDWQRTVSISDGKVRPKIRKLSSGEIDILINNGRQAVKSYLN